MRYLCILLLFSPINAYSQNPTLSNMQIEYTGNSEKTTLLIAQKGLPTFQSVSSVEEFSQAIENKCGNGNLRGSYIAYALRKNFRALSEIEYLGNTIVEVPACARHELEIATVPIRKNGPNWSQCLNDDTGITTSCSRHSEVKLDLRELQVTAQNYKPTAFEDSDNRTRALHQAAINQLASSRILYRMSEPDLQHNKVPTKSDTAYFTSSFDNKIRSLSQAIYTREAIVLNAGVNFASLTKNDVIKQTQTAATVSGTIDFPSVNDADEFKREIENSKQLKNSIKNLSSMSGILSADVKCKAPDDNINIWPIDVKAFNRALNLNKIAGAWDDRNTGRILVVDTGFPSQGAITPEFQDRLLIVNSTVEQNLHPIDAEFFKLFRHTLDLVPTGSAVPFFDGVKSASHGIGVSLQALGGLGMVSEKTMPPQNMLASGLAYKTVFSSENGRELKILLEAAVRGIDGSGWNTFNFDIVNLSFEYYSLSEGANNQIQVNIDSPKRQKTLFIAAAGNRGKNIPGRMMMPAMLGGRNRNNLIVVGATKLPGMKADFSDLSDVYADISAPGCGIATKEWDEVRKSFITKRMSGTSYAAPLVSFVASYLSQQFAIRDSRGKDLSFPGAAKRRIIGTSTYSENLRATRANWAHGELAPAQAISTTIDVVKMVDGSIHFGRIGKSANDKSWRHSLAECDDSQLQMFPENLIKWQKFGNDKKQHFRIAISRGAELTPNFFGPCSLPDTYLMKKISFRDIAINEGNLEIENARELLIKDIASITFCDYGYCFNQ